MKWYLEALKKYAVFRGRSRRKEFWYFVLFSMLAYTLLRVIDNLIGTRAIPIFEIGMRSTVYNPGVAAAVHNPSVGMGLLAGLYSLAVLVPTIAVTVRRLHDTGHSGWWLLINLVPFIGLIVFLVFMAQKTEQGDNQYGPDPMAAKSTAA